MHNWFFIKTEGDSLCALAIEKEFATGLTPRSCHSPFKNITYIQGPSSGCFPLSDKKYGQETTYLFFKINAMVRRDLKAPRIPSYQVKLDVERGSFLPPSPLHTHKHLQPNQNLQFIPPGLIFS